MIKNYMVRRVFDEKEVRKPAAMNVQIFEGKIEKNYDTIVRQRQRSQDHDMEGFLKERKVRSLQISPRFRSKEDGYFANSYLELLNDNLLEI